MGKSPFRAVFRSTRGSLFRGPCLCTPRLAPRCLGLALLVQAGEQEQSRRRGQEQKMETEQ